MKEGPSGLTPATKSQNTALDPGQKDGSLPYYQLLSSSHITWWVVLNVLNPETNPTTILEPLPTLQTRKREK